MKRFEIYAGPTHIGWSDLEAGDPPMGVAFGIFTPNERYAEIQAECRRNHSAQTTLELSIKFGSRKVECEGVGILDSEDLGSDEIEVNALGIPSWLYEELFPGRYAQYENTLKK